MTVDLLGVKLQKVERREPVEPVLCKPERPQRQKKKPFEWRFHGQYMERCGGRMKNGRGFWDGYRRITGVRRLRIMIRTAILNLLWLVFVLPFEKMLDRRAA